MIFNTNLKLKHTLNSNMEVGTFLNLSGSLIHIADLLEGLGLKKPRK
jgi:hypothetical protein